MVSKLRQAYRFSIVHQVLNVTLIMKLEHRYSHIKLLFTILQPSMLNIANWHTNIYIKAVIKYKVKGTCIFLLELGSTC